MIDEYRNLKQLSLKDGKYYNSKDIKEITEKAETIELTTKNAFIIIPKNSISRIEYYNSSNYYYSGGADGRKKHR